jgi:hypothetical protein
MSTSGQWTTAGFVFDRASLGNGPFPVSAAAAPWSSLGSPYQQLPDPSSSNWDIEGGPAAYDPVSRELFAFVRVTVANPRHPFYSINTVTKAYRTYPEVTTPVTAILRTAVCCPDLRIIVLFSQDGSARYLDIRNADAINAGLSSPINQTGSPRAAGERYFGAVYHQPSRSILCWNLSGSLAGGINYGTTLRKLSIPNPLSGSWVWSQVTANTPTANPGASASAAYQGPNTKFNIVNDMGDGHGALVCVNGVTQPTYVYKLPVGAIS